MPGYTRETIKAVIGTEVGLSKWITIDQSMIDRFADLTDDHQFIHVDTDRAAKTPMGGTIAHGFLTLSMLGGLATVADIGMAGATMGFNYGFNKIRFITPVRSGSRVRARFTLIAMEERSPGQWMATMGVSVEIEGQDKPALTAEWLTLTITAA
ncbi:MAG: MaoC family dehydratase [Sphingomonas sp.]|uniref:MaoC family dehydratase n=1 Tax=Sphingomonas sp. TaxID=28214 RepID=UPI0035A93D7A|nr:MaoC family dehydratase [Sphingomonas sp.]